MKAVFSPSSPFGEVFAPPSKSMAHRYLICGALSEQSRVSGLAMSEDIKATADCLKALGSRVVLKMTPLLWAAFARKRRRSSTAEKAAPPFVLCCLLPFSAIKK